jgi:hypothetical protein
MHHIQEIVEIEPYKVTVLFDHQERREINFVPLLHNFPELRNVDVFKRVTLDDYPTLVWQNLGKIRELDGTITSTPLDFCPDYLYSISQPK